MAQTKAARVAAVPAGGVPDIAAELGLAAACIHGREAGRFVVVGHRGKGMNALAAADRRLREVKENSVASFNEAARFAVDFVEFDVQVTRDGCPVIFHDNFILTEEDGNISEKRVTDLRLEEFLSYGPQKEDGKVGKAMLRRMKDGKIVSWSVESDDALCTLDEAFERVNPRLGFNIELKFDDDVLYQEEELTSVLQAILQVVSSHAKGRPIFFSSFQPDAAQLMRKLQHTYPVYFLTNGGTEAYGDARRNSLEEAMKLCLASGLQGIVSEVRAIFRDPSAVPKIKEARLSLLTYGQLNNVAEAVYMQHLMGVDGVIVDLVQEITEAVAEFAVAPGGNSGDGRAEDQKEPAPPNFSQREISFLLRLIPKLVQ